MVERRRVLPLFPERVRHIAYRGPVDLELRVMPRRSLAESGIDVYALLVALLVLAVVATVAQIDAADEGDVVLGAMGSTDHEQLLVVAAGGRTRSSSNTSPPASLTVSTRWRFSCSLKWAWSACERQTRPRTCTSLSARRRVRPPLFHHWSPGPAVTAAGRWSPDELACALPGILEG